MTKTHGLLRWKALPMGFKNSSAYFQRAIEAALGGLRFTCCVVYIDDVVVHSKGSFEDHVAKVQAALRALRVVGFSDNPAKRKFVQREAEGKVHARDDKVKVMLDYKAPTSITELRSCLGLFSYYRRFIKDCSTVARFDEARAQWPITAHAEERSQGNVERRCLDRRTPEGV